MKEGWIVKKLGVCFSYIKNGANIKQDKNSKGFPITRIETLANGVFNRDRFGYADIFDLSNYDSFVLQDMDILMSHINSKTYIGRSVIYKREGSEQIIHGMNLLRLIAIKEILNPYFANYYFKTINFKNDVAKIRKDAVNQSSMAISDLKRICIPIPPLEEQTKIVEELDQLSNIIEKQRQQLSELDNLAQSIFYDMFGDPVTNEKGWEVENLKSLTSKIGSGSTPKGGNESYKDEGISLIRSLNVYNNCFKYKDLAHIDDEQATSLNNVTIEKGDVLLNITGASVARCCIVPVDVLPARVNQHVSIIRGKDMINNLFLNYLLTSSAYQSLLIMLSKSNGATREALTKSQLETLKIILPPLSLQQLFAQKIEAIEQEKEIIKQSIAETEELFNSRMDYYFG